MKPLAHSLIATKMILLAAALLAAPPAPAQLGPDSYTMKLYHVNYGFYPIVEAYIRTWDTNHEPLLNLNIANIGLSVKGRNYNPRTAVIGEQYSIETIERRREGFRTVIVLDCSGSMRGEPFTHAIDALNRFIEAKRPVDQIAIIAIRDTSTGYELISDFTNSPSDLYRRLSDARPDGQQTHLYDSIAEAMRMSAAAVRGDLTSMDYAVLSSIVVLSDGLDEGSSISRSDLINRIGQLSVPVPVHSIAFTRINRDHLRNMEAISAASFGRYFDLQETSQLTRTMEQIHRINRSDYVVTFRAYVPVDGESHTFRIGVEYPSGTGSFIFGTGSFEAIESPAVFNPNTEAHYRGLLARYPENPEAAFGAGPAAQAPHAERPTDRRSEPIEVSAAPSDSRPEPFEVAAAPSEPEPFETAASAAEPRPEPEAADDDQDEILAMMAVNAPLIGAAVVLLLVLVLAVVWVRKGSRVDESSVPRQANRATSDPPKATTNRGARRGAEAATRASDDWTN